MHRARTGIEIPEAELADDPARAFGDRSEGRQNKDAQSAIEAVGMESHEELSEPRHLLADHLGVASGALRSSALFRHPDGRHVGLSDDVVPAALRGPSIINAGRHLHHLPGIGKGIGDLEHGREAAPVRAKRKPRPHVLMGDAVADARSRLH